MESYSPELSLHWLRSCADGAEDGGRVVEDAPSRLQQEALEALADRVNAARCVI